MRSSLDAVISVAVYTVYSRIDKRGLALTLGEGTNEFVAQVSAEQHRWLWVIGLDE